MKVFISWSGDRSQALAVALKDWLPLVLHYLEPWISTADIKSGDRWSAEIAKGLQETNFGIICVTKDNLEAPWLLFESGALAKSMEDGRVIPLRLDIEVSDIAGPLAQFQSEKSDAVGIKRLVSSLNNIATAPVPEERLNRLFDATWPDLKAKIDAIPQGDTSPKRSRPQADILEELVAGVRSVEMRFRDMVDDEPTARRRFGRKFHPEMLMEFSRQISSHPHDPVQLLVISSLFREDMPWIYELATDFYRAARSGDRLAASEALDRFREAVLMIRRGPFIEMAGRDTRLAYSLLLDTIESMPIEGVLSVSSKSKRGSVTLKSAPHAKA